MSRSKGQPSRGRSCTWVAILVAVFGAVLGAGVDGAFGEEPATRPAADDTDAAAPHDVFFPEGTQLFSTEASYVIGVEDGEDIPTLTLGYDLFVIDNLSLGVGLKGSGIFLDDVDEGQEDQTFGIGLDARLRHHVLTSDNASLFISVGVGPFYGHDPVPAGGTRFNFVSHAGLGTAVRLDDNLFLTAGVEYWHLSNGNVVDGENPAINGVQTFVGLGWTF